MNKQRLVVGISGGSGAILGIRLLQALTGSDIETHLILTPSARLTIAQETDWKVEDVLALTTRAYDPLDLSAPVASGSFGTLGMVVIPCSIKSLSAIANSYNADLLTRAADVTLKEGRPLILVVREAPLHAGHARLMQQAASTGAILFPPVPAFYTRPSTVEDVVDNIVGRVLRRMGIENTLYQEWQGPVHSAPKEAEQDVWAVPAMTLATVSAAGAPHAADVYFSTLGEADQERTLYFFSDATSQHSLDLATNPYAAVTIYPAVTGWQEIRGVQMRGQVRVVEPGAAWDAAWEGYLVKFPFASALKDIVAQNTLYAFRPDWIRRIDNRRGFGHKEEWTRQ